MRSDIFRPKTLLPIALMAWAIALLGLAYLGLGGRYAPLPDDPSLAKSIPKVGGHSLVAQLGPVADYEIIGTRPLLMPNRQPAPVLAADGQADNNELDVVLTSVLMTNRLQMVIFKDNKSGVSRRVRVGENIEGTAWRLSLVEPRRATLDGPSGQKIFDLRVFDGNGGEAPTALVQNPSQPSAGSTPAATVMAKPPVAVAIAKPGNPATFPGMSQPSEGPEMTQEQQLEAIRARIAARRASMQAESQQEAAKIRNK